MDDNTYECPNCGAKIYPEMTRCPECGQNMYPEEEETLPATEATAKGGWGATIGVLMIGMLIASGIALILHFILATFAKPSTLGGLGKAVLVLAGPLGCLVGGYVSGGLARQHPKFLGAVEAALTLPILALFATHWVEVTPGFLLTPMALLVGLLTILAGVVGGWLSVMFSGNVAWKEKWQVRGWEDLLYQDLLRKVRFNGSIADRLIKYEREQDPQASRLKLIQNAIERWERDNR